MGVYYFIYIHAELYAFSYIFTCSLCVYEVGAAYKRAASVFFRQKERVPGFLDYVKSGNYQNFNMCGFWDLSTKTRAAKSWVLAVLRPPDLSRAVWWTKWWLEFWTPNKEFLDAKQGRFRCQSFHVVLPVYGFWSHSFSMIWNDSIFYIILYYFMWFGWFYMIWYVLLCDSICFLWFLIFLFDLCVMFIIVLYDVHRYLLTEPLMNLQINWFVNNSIIESIHQLILN